MKLLQRKLDWSAGPPAENLRDAADAVMDGNILILKKAFPEHLMDRCKAALLDWQSRNPESNPDRLKTAANWWRRDIDPPSRTPHLFETFCFAFDDAEDGLSEVEEVFETVAATWRILTDRTEGLALDATGRALRPQVIHYPRGGGFFDSHTHDLDPQRIGLIVGMSKQGRDFDTGGAVFKTDGAEIHTDDAHDIGDICLFRYDLDHRVSAVDANRPLEWGGTGRWTMVLPLM